MIPDLFAVGKNRILSVRELNLTAKQLLENSLPLLWVGGEISNFVSAASGHWYFSLKDEYAQVRCVMFRQKNQYLDWQPTNGIQVEVLALPTLYEARGDFQLTLEQMRPAGLGALYETFELLKRKLQGEGLFDTARKRPLPFMPTQIGVITSPQAAALRDVLTTLSKRISSIPIVLYPTPVQGTGSADKIAQAIELANKRAECDVLLLCRGGGSIEDLWAFNEEVVARAIAASRIPIVCGVGHETDITIADFVADQRAATPTAAAQGAVPDRLQLLHHLQQLAQHLARSNQRQSERRMQQLDYLQRCLIHPALRVQQQSEHVVRLYRRIHGALAHTLQHQQWRWQSLRQRLMAARPNLVQPAIHCAALASRLPDALHRALQRHDVRLNALQQHLHHLDPNQVLARGYSLVRDAQGSVVSDAQQLSVGMELRVTFAKGWAQTEVKVLGGTHAPKLD